MGVRHGGTLRGDNSDRPGQLRLHAFSGRDLHREPDGDRQSRARGLHQFLSLGHGKDWVPWNDESQFKMDLVPDRSRYSVGDTATVLFASPFTDAEAWVTVEREGLIEQRRLKLTAGSTTLKFPITEKYPPNAFVSVLVARGRSAPPGRSMIRAVRRFGSAMPSCGSRRR